MPNLGKKTRPQRYFNVGEVMHSCWNDATDSAADPDPNFEGPESSAECAKI
jgi:hypothetical protein